MARPAPDQHQLKLRVKMPGAGKARPNELPTGEGFTVGKRNKFKLHAAKGPLSKQRLSFIGTSESALAKNREGFANGSVAAA